MNELTNINETPIFYDNSTTGAKSERKTITMRKAHSPHEITFTADEDPHFVNIEIVRKTTGEVRGQHYILKSDLPTWLEYYEGDGFTIVEQNNE